MHAEPAPRRFPEAVRVRVPRGFPAAVEMAARQQLTSPSEYLRRAVLHALRADGVRLDANGHIELSDTGGRMSTSEPVYSVDIEPCIVTPDGAQR